MLEVVDLGVGAGARGRLQGQKQRLVRRDLSENIDYSVGGASYVMGKCTPA